MRQLYYQLLLDSPIFLTPSFEAIDLGHDPQKTVHHVNFNKAQDTASADGHDHPTNWKHAHGQAEQDSSKSWDRSYRICKT